ncbi:hypothetical protein [Rhodanobacter koreensis]
MLHRDLVYNLCDRYAQRLAQAGDMAREMHACTIIGMLAALQEFASPKPAAVCGIEYVPAMNFG